MHSPLKTFSALVFLGQQMANVFFLLRCRRAFRASLPRKAPQRSKTTVISLLPQKKKERAGGPTCSDASGESPPCVESPRGGRMAAHSEDDLFVVAGRAAKVGLAAGASVVRVRAEAMTS